MRSIVIPKCPYETFKAIRHAILKTQPHGLLSSTFDTEDESAYFNFWDSQYVPVKLEKYTSNDQRANTTTLEGIELPMNEQELLEASLGVKLSDLDA